MPTREEARAEILQLIRGSPQPGVGIEGLAERTGLRFEEARDLVDELVAEGRLLRDGEQLVAVERNA
jgi:DNA-binding IclR family transcriptional regulator